MKNKKRLTIEFHPNPKEETVIREIMDFCLDMGIQISPAQALRSLVTFGIELHLAKKHADNRQGSCLNGHHLVEEFLKEQANDS